MFMLVCTDLLYTKVVANVANSIQVRELHMAFNLKEMSTCVFVCGGGYVCEFLHVLTAVNTYSYHTFEIKLYSFFNTAIKQFLKPFRISFSSSFLHSTNAPTLITVTNMQSGFDYVRCSLSVILSN